MFIGKKKSFDWPQIHIFNRDWNLYQFWVIPKKSNFHLFYFLFLLGYSPLLSASHESCTRIEKWTSSHRQWLKCPKDEYVDMDNVSGLACVAYGIDVFIVHIVTMIYIMGKSISIIILLTHSVLPIKLSLFWHINWYYPDRKTCSLTFSLCLFYSFHSHFSLFFSIFTFHNHDNQIPFRNRLSSSHSHPSEWSEPQINLTNER